MFSFFFRKYRRAVAEAQAERDEARRERDEAITKLEQMKGGIRLVLDSL